MKIVYYLRRYVHTCCTYIKCIMNKHFFLNHVCKCSIVLVIEININHALNSFSSWKWDINSFDGTIQPHGCLNGPFPASFSFIFFFSTVNYKILLMTEFELWTSGIGSDRSVNWDTALFITKIFNVFASWWSAYSTRKPKAVGSNSASSTI